MPMHRKNTSKATRQGAGEEWFFSNLERQRNRKKMAKLSKKRNRKK